MKPNNYFSTTNIKLYGGLLFSALFFSTSQAQAYYLCPANFYYAAGAGCVPTNNSYSNGITVTPGYNYGSTYYSAPVHDYYPNGGYNNVGHYNYGGSNYYHHNWGGGEYHHR